MKGAAFVILLVLLILIALPVASILGNLAVVMDQFWNNGRLQRTFGGFLWEKSSQNLLIAIPLFILLGEIILRAGIAARMYAAMTNWIGWLPGGLMHANIGASALFAATSGSSVATSATIGTVAYPEIRRHGYNESLFLGTIAAGGTLGILIPPSVLLIVYGVLTQTSVPELYLAGLIPGIVLALLFSLTVAIMCLVRPSLAGRPVRASWSARLRSLRDLIPPLVIFLGVIGTIYAGIATPTEAASIGVVLAMGLALLNGTLSVRMLLESFEGTVRTTSMIMIIILAAMILNVVIGFFGVIQAATQLVGALGLEPWQLMLIIVVFYLVIGLFMETFSMMLTTIGIVFPLVISMGYDPVWFGVVVVLLMEAALITPPIGVNLFVVQGIRERGSQFRDVCVGAAPFVVAMLAMVFLLMWQPGLATWLPDLVYSR